MRWKEVAANATSLARGSSTLVLFSRLGLSDSWSISYEMS